MATYYERGDGQVEATVRVAGYPPQRKTWSSKTLAKQWAEPIEAAMRAGTWQEAETKGLTVRAGITVYKDKIAPRYKDVSEKCRICDVLAKEFGDYAMAHLPSAAIAAYRDRLRARGLGASTVNHHINQLSAVYTGLVKELHYKLPVNPAKNVMRLKPPPARKQRVKQEVIEWLVAANQASNKTRKKLGGRPPIGEFEPWLRLALESAMRRGEQAALLIENVDLEAQTAELPDTKTGDSRTIALSSKAVECLRKVIGTRKSGKVFTLTKEGFKTAYRRARQDAAREHPEVKRIRYHDTRREATSRLAKKLDIIELGNQTGHKKLDTLRIYYRPDPAEVAKKLG